MYEYFSFDVTVFFNVTVQLEQERRELRSQLLVLKENREAEEEELQTRSRALVHTAEELAQHRAESSNLRLVPKRRAHSSHLASTETPLKLK